MMIQDAKTGAVIQAVPLTEGKVNVTTGAFTVQGLIHCEADGDVVLKFKGGDVTYPMKAGEDRAYNGDITVSSGTFTVA